MGIVGMRMSLKKKYCSYIPALTKALEMVDGDVLELGAGPHSTLFLHWMCLRQGRNLVTYENNQKFYNMVKHCESSREEKDFHKVIFVEDWDEIFIEKFWGIVFIDHSPAIRRIEEIKRVQYYAQCLVVHDTEGRNDRKFRYSEIYPLFKYRRNYSKWTKGVSMPQTTLLSNFVDVTKWS
jgi:hypothetical protein